MVNMVYHVLDILDIITSAEIPINNPSKDYAAIYLKNYMVTVLGNKNKGQNKSSGA